MGKTKTYPGMNSKAGLMRVGGGWALLDSKIRTCWELLGLVPDVQSTLRGHEEIRKTAKHTQTCKAHTSRASLEAAAL